MTTINTDQNYQNRVKHFTALKDKYQANSYQNLSPNSPLYFILRKADLGIEILDLEYIWLQKENLLATVQVIRNQQQQRIKDTVDLGVEFTKLKSKYQVNNYHISWAVSPLYFILCKVDSGNFLTEKEFNWLISNGFKKVNSIAIENQKFISLKSKYNANKYQDSHSDSPLYPILKKIDISERLTELEYKWLIEQELSETLEFVKQQEATRRNEFIQLKEKYQATKYKSGSLSSPLYPILQKLEAEENLIDTELTWLKEQELIETITIAEEKEKTKEFAALKIKYQATEYEDISPKSHLYKVLKNVDSGNSLGGQDVNFLKKRKLLETIKLANDKYINHLKSKIEENGLLTDSEIEWLKNNGREDIISLVQKRLFSILKSKYTVSNYQDQSPNSPLYLILQKLEKDERIEPKDVGWLQENNLFYGKIWTKYHIIEANFYQQEFKRTGNRWNLVNASSHLRKADRSKSALELTDNLPLNSIKDNKLKSALLTTRGGAFRDCDKLDYAEICALQAMKYQADSHHPYTLMGAICYQQGKYFEGDKWFNEAIKRGAKPLDMDSEIKSILKKAKDEKQRQELVNYLLKKDSNRYAWAKNYLKKQQDKK
ncbi:hypothetical protein [Dolichospermum circinale]|uniref:hypothetical protein n=1 Tax=Dolichospermum circinale TaxID=109265 RepID=UPI00232B9403|nr:hypothetical protein [Dolichospermum circinale]MDB9456701.1 hypothetical protein [Dolichospermum circinale CS-541/06]MDB9462231.1 hypothetical protein [Dolichospermum circinale CS-541/04]MDB9548018.1 hypothetical protein [Dolichospermum circinale CS-1031]